MVESRKESAKTMNKVIIIIAQCVNMPLRERVYLSRLEFVTYIVKLNSAV